MRRAFVCGHPIRHSRSPLIHGHWLAEHGVEGDYEAVDVAPDGLVAFLDAVRAGSHIGGNVTIPHKEAAFAAADVVDEVGQRIGAVNTVWAEDGRLHATNTDAYGFAANLDDRAPGWEDVGSAVVLGAGGAARAVVAALVSRGIARIAIVNRTVPRAAEIAARFGNESTAYGWEALSSLLPSCDLLVNTTSIGLEGEGAGALPPLDALPSGALVTDIVYAPLMTPMLARASERGLRTVDGLGMLLHQAVPGFERWFGVRPEVTPGLRRIVEKDIGL